MFQKLLLVVGVVGVLASGSQAGVVLDFGRIGQPASTIASWAYEYAIDRLNPPATGPYTQTVASYHYDWLNYPAVGSFYRHHNVTISAREDSGANSGPPFFTPAVPGIRSDNRSAAVVPIGENVQLFQDVVRVQGDRSLGVDVGNASGRIPVIMFTIDNLDPNTPYPIEIGGFDGGVTPATYTYIVQATAGSGTTGVRTTYGFTIGSGGGIFSGSNPAANSLWTGSTTFTTNSSGVLSFEVVLDLANSLGSDDLVLVSFLDFGGWTFTAPEPTSLSIVAVGGLMMFVRRRRA